MPRTELYVRPLENVVAGRRAPAAARSSSRPAPRQVAWGIKDTLLALQRTAGNAAVLQLLDRDAGAAAGGAAKVAGKAAARGPAPGDVVYVSFQNAPPPAAPERDLPPPTSAATQADRAGLTRVNLQARMPIAWDTGAPEPDGRVPLFAKSVNLFFRLDPIRVFVARDYPEGSCPYVATLEHERAHVSAFLRLFHAARDPIAAELRGAPIPTSGAPRLVAPADVDRIQNGVGDDLAKIVRDSKARLRQAMKADRAARDSASAYQSTYRRCRIDEWLSTP